MLATSLFRESNTVPDEAVLQCRLGSLAIKTNLVDKAAAGFTRALSLNPLLWEAFEGLCAAGAFHWTDLSRRHCYMLYRSFSGN